MQSVLRAVLFICAYFTEWAVECCRILVVVPTPIHSHQVIFRPFTEELVRQGHELVVLTTDPAFPPGKAPQNLTEIRLCELSHKLWNEGFQKAMTLKEIDYKTQMQIAFEIMVIIFQKQMQTKEVIEMLADKNQRFDLVIIEAWVYQALALVYIYNAPAVLMSTFGIADEMYDHFQDPTDHIPYLDDPDMDETRRYNYSLWEHARIVSNRLGLHHIVKLMEKRQDDVLRKLFGENMPPLQELTKNVEVEFVNMHPVWTGGSKYVPPKDLAEVLQQFMNFSKYGVIYMSLGSNGIPTLLTPERLEVFSRVFASLPYDVLWEWKDAPRNLSKNVHTFSWLPQSYLLQHPKLVLFITQGGLQSTDEALRAGVPLLGIPLLIDQWLITENYERLGVGMQLDILTLSDESLEVAIDILVKIKSFRENAKLVGRTMEDRSQSALATAVWRVENVLRRRGRCMSSSVPLLTSEELVNVLLLILITLLALIAILALFLYKHVTNLGYLHILIHFPVSDLII